MPMAYSCVCWNAMLQNHMLQKTTLVLGKGAEGEIVV
jgi:hypothetical protein